MFEHFAQFSTSSETWATRATWVTETPKPRKSAASEPDCPVTQNENTWATVGNQQKAVTLVTQRQEEWATEGDGQKTAESCGFSEPVTQVAQVTQENGKAGIAEWNGEDWLAFFHERAGIREFDGGMSRADAEVGAYECSVITWMNNNPVPANGPDRCAHCDKPMTEYEALPFLNGGGHVWLHDTCHAAWIQCYRADAREALAEFGLPLVSMSRTKEKNHE